MQNLFQGKNLQENYFHAKNCFPMQACACTPMHESVHARSMHGAFSVDIYITKLRGALFKMISFIEKEHFRIGKN